MNPYTENSMPWKTKFVGESAKEQPSRRVKEVVEHMNLGTETDLRLGIDVPALEPPSNGKVSANIDSITSHSRYVYERKYGDASIRLEAQTMWELLEMVKTLDR